ncbi:MAG: hypothetical protein LBT79_06525, partial [Elusimicrobiota bacterium]|nr:hypothetical protein [Elusimicrobiota bacterium]
NDAKDFNIEILPPDIQYSCGKFAVENENIRFGLLATKTVGERVAETIEEARKEGGQFKDWNDFLQRVDLKSINKLAMESLAKAGVFDCFGQDKAKIRAQIIKDLDSTMDKAAKFKDEKSQAQGFLFDSAKEFKEDFILSDCPPLENNRMLEYEKEVLGFYLSGHPLSGIKNDLIRYSDCSLNNLPAIEEDQSYRDAPKIQVAGMISSIKKAVSKKKEEYAKFKIEDMDGFLNAIMFPKAYTKYQGSLIANSVAVIKGQLIGSPEKPELAVDEMMSLQEAKKTIKPKIKSVHIKFTTTRYDEDLNKALTQIFEKYKGGVSVFLDISDSTHGKFTIDTKYKILCNNNFITDIEEAVGNNDIVSFG